MSMEKNVTIAGMSFNPLIDNTLTIRLSGDWKIGNKLPSIDELQRYLDSEAGIQKVSFDTNALLNWDSIFLAFLLRIINLCSQKKILINNEALPVGARKLLALASAVGERKGVRRESVREPFFDRIGATALDIISSFAQTLSFLGEACFAVVRLLCGKARFRRSDLFLIIQECSVSALPIVSLISLLVGMILAFVGAVQLVMFGAQIYIASLVGIAMVRVMGAIMTGIIMAGRTGAAFAAQLGTMQVNEEIDALKTMGISPMEFLVLPRMVALALMMPLLCIYADLMGVLGGLVVGVGLLDLNVAEYYNMTRASISLKDFWIGLFQSSVFGVLVAISGCLKGMQCGRSASAVGNAATSAVVTGIVSIIVATAIITVLCNVIGI